MTDTTQDDLVKRASFALSDMQGRVDAGKLQVFEDCIDRIEELEAKLVKAVEALREISQESMGEDGCYYTNLANIKRARITLAELKGQDDE